MSRGLRKSLLQTFIVDSKKFIFYELKAIQPLNLMDFSPCQRDFL
jgi:hypothetical protein